jgi:hypothetical protein
MSPRALPIALIVLLVGFAGPTLHAKSKKRKEREKEAKAAKILTARFATPLSGLRQLLATPGGDDAILHELRKHGRGLAFALEGLYRIYEDHYPETMTGFREKTKELEDRLGWYIDSEDHLDYARAIGLTPEKDPMVFTYLNARRDENRAQFLEFLRGAGWLRSTKHPDMPQILDTMESRIAATSWDSLAEDHDFVTKYLRKEIDRHLIHTDYDMHDLDNGLHKFRRELRWILVETQALHGDVVLDDRPVPAEFRAILSDPIRQSEFANITDREDQGYHIFFPRAYYLAMTKGVEDLGRAKDVGEAAQEWLSEALWKSGAAASESEAQQRAEQLAKHHPHYVDRLKLASQTYQTIKGTKLLKNLRDNLEGQRSFSKKDCRALFRDSVS